MSSGKRSIVDSTLLAAATIVGFGIAYIYFAHSVLEAFPFSGDEYSMVLQGDIFAHGMLRAPAPDHASWLWVDHVVMDGWVRSKYPPGAPAVFSIGARFGVTWLVNPVVGTLTLAIVWRTLRGLFSGGAALTGVVVLGFAPLYIYSAGSFYAHAPTVLFLALSFAALASWTQTQRLHWLALAGIALGCAFLTRPVDALLFGVAVCALRSIKAVALTAAAAVPFVAIGLWYQHAQFGSLLTTGYAAYAPALKSIYNLEVHEIGLVNLLDQVQQYNHVEIFKQFVFDWSVLGSPLLALAGLRGSERTLHIRTFAVAVIVINVLALLFMSTMPDDGPHPRYLTTTLLPLAALAAAGFDRIAPLLTSIRSRVLAAVAIVLALWVTTSHFRAFLYWHVGAVHARKGLYDAVAAHDLPHGSIVIVEASFPTRYTRNGPFFDGDVLYLALREGAVTDVRAQFPGRQIWIAQESARWQMTRVQ